MKFVDLHEDLAYRSSKIDVREDSQQSSVKALRSLGDVTVFSVLYPHVSTWDERADLLAKVYGRPTESSSPLFQLVFEQVKFYLFLEHKKLAKVVRSRGDLGSQGLKLVFALEGTDVLQDPYDLYVLKELHVHAVGLTWNYDNKFAASCMSKKDYGLTGYGEELVDQCNVLGMILDLAHSSKKTLLDVASITSKPIIASHANVRRLKEHARNLDDEELEAVVKTGGIVGVTAINPTLSDNPCIEDIVKHASYIGERFGWEHVAVGTDFLGIDEAPKGFEDVTKIARLAELLGEHAEQVLWKNACRLLSSTMT